MLLERRTQLVNDLAEARSRLLGDALEAEQRERKALAEALHDEAIQNLLSARHELEEVAEGAASGHPALGRADDALALTVHQLRQAIFDLHPYVLDEAGLESAIRSVAVQAATRAELELDLDLRYGKRHPQEQLVFSAARELLANVVRHARATRVRVDLFEDSRELVLVVEDDGEGFPAERLTERLADGHVGLASQRFRIEAAGGSLKLVSKPGEGARAEIRLPE
jgi:two-component system NarL family sensor kinase